MDIVVPEPSGRTLFETTLTPSASSLQRLRPTKYSNESEIGKRFGQKAKVSVGKPVSVNIASNNNFDLHTISLSCSFLPDLNFIRADSCPFMPINGFQFNPGVCAII